MEETDILIIGAGVVGLAVAAELALEFPDSWITVMEQREKFGQDTSSRNSEVIHAGIYYPAGSLKAHHCVEGKDLLYRFCREHKVPHLQTGKLIVARSYDEIKPLEELLKQGKENGVEDLEMLDAHQVSRLEPAIKAEAALLSPSSGIVDTHNFMARLDWLARQRGALLAYYHRALGAEKEGERYVVYFYNPDGSKDSMSCRCLINCAGLDADRVASWLGINPHQAGYRIYPCKGEYFSVSYRKSGLISRLIYPPPLENLEGLGVHATRTLDGRVRLGPNAFYEEDPEYRVDPRHVYEFWEAARTFLPFLELEDLEPEMAGIRPKLQGPGQVFRDFVLQHEEKFGLKGLINLIGIESPGFTASLSLARKVAGLIREV